MKIHYCPIEKTILSFEGECNWCGLRAINMSLKGLKLVYRHIYR